MPLKDVPGWDAEGAYEVGHFFTILLNIAFDNGQDWIMGGATHAAPEEDVVRPSAGGANRQLGGIDGEGKGEENSPADAPAEPPAPPPTPAWFLPWYAQTFGRVAGGEAVRCLQAAATHGKLSPPIPQYEFAARKVVSGRLVLVGDAAHMASPRTAAGAHTAVLDAAGLFNAFAPLGNLGGGDAPAGGWGAVVDRGLEAYGPPGLRRAAALYARSVEVSAPVAAPGWRRKTEL